MKRNSIKSATIVITGASSGIGKAASILFAKEGANLVLAARSIRHLLDVVLECRKVGAKCIAVETDVSDKESVQRLMKRAVDTFGDVSVWINNAGVGVVGEFASVPLKDHEQVIRTNLIGPLYGSYVVLPYYLKKKRGIIINTNSTGSFLGCPFAVSYSASKFGLRGLSEALRFEVKDYKDIHICELYGAFVDTAAPSHAANYTGKKLSLPKPLMSPEKMAQGLVTLAKSPRPMLHLGLMDRLGRLGHFMGREKIGYGMNKIVRFTLRESENSPFTDGNLFPPSSGETSLISQGYS